LRRVSIAREAGSSPSARQGPTDRRCRILARETHVALLEIARRDVVHAGVPQDEVERRSLRHGPRGATDDHPQLPLVVDAPARGRQPDRLEVGDQRRRGFEEQERLGRNVVTELRRVRSVIAADSHDLGGRDGRPPGQTTERPGRADGSQPAEGIPLRLPRPIVSLEERPEGPPHLLEPGDAQDAGHAGADGGAPTSRAPCTFLRRCRRARPLPPR
jgi:hypothetical protein